VSPVSFNTKISSIWNSWKKFEDLEQPATARTDHFDLKTVLAAPNPVVALVVARFSGSVTSILMCPLGTSLLWAVAKEHSLRFACKDSNPVV